METEDDVRPRTTKEELRRRALKEIYGLVSASRVDPWILRFWEATQDIQILRMLLEVEIQSRPEIENVLARVIEIEGKLVTSCRVIERK